MNEDLNDLLEIDSSPGSPVEEESTAEPEKIGGWLILPAIGFILGGIVSLISFGISLSIASDIPSRYQEIFAVNLLFAMGLFVYFIYAATRFFGKRKNAPATIIALMIAGIAVNVLLLLLNIGADADPFTIETAKALAQSVISSAIWIPYFRVSKRVKRTFVVP